MQFEVEETPLEGTVIGLNPEYREYNGNKYLVLDIQRPDGTMGTMSISRLSDTQVIQDQYQVVKNGDNAGSIMLKSSRVSGDLVRNLGKSDAERISAIIGKTYKAERVTGYSLVEYTPEALFVSPKTKDKPTKAELKQLWDNTAINERLFKFLEIR